MSPPVEIAFYFGIRSRYSYLAATQIEWFERETGARMAWQCVGSGELMAAAGFCPFEGAPSSGQYDWPYRRQDAADWARFYGVPFCEPAIPMADAWSSTLACVAAEWMGAAAPYSRRLFARHFAEGYDVLDAAALADEAAACGLARARKDYGHAPHAPKTVFRAPVRLSGDPADPDWSATGAFGDATLASAKKGRAILDAMVFDLLDGLNQIFLDHPH